MMHVEEVKNTAKNRRLLLRVIAILAIFLPWNIGILVNSLINQDIIMMQNKPVETLVVKIVYSPELAAYIGSWSFSEGYEEYMVDNIGGFFMIEWLMKNGEVKISIANETRYTLKVDELKNNVKLLNWTVKGLQVNVAAAILNIPCPRYAWDALPYAVKRNARVLLENQSFIKWLKEEGFTYMVGGMSSIPREGAFDFDKITGVMVELAVGNLMLHYPLYFDKPYILLANVSIPVEIKESPYELENFGVYVVFMHSSDFRYITGSEIFSHGLPPEYWNITRPESPPEYPKPEHPFVSKRLTFDIMSETGQKVMKILNGNRLTRRLMEYFQCEVREIARWELSNGVIDSTAIVALVCREKKCEFSIRIDLNAEMIREIYFYPLISP